MILNTEDLYSLRILAEELAEKAGIHVMNSLSETHEVMQKDAGSSLASQLVTKTDLESQEIILAGLKDSIKKYDLGILTEETADDHSRFKKDYFWCIDPLDGTLSFTRKIEGFSVSIALVSKSGEPVLGVVYNPWNKNLYSSLMATNVLLNKKEWVPKKLSEAFTLIYDQSILKSQHYEKIINYFKRKHKTAHEISTRGAVLNAIGVLENAPAIYFKPTKPELGGGSIWDFASTVSIFKELGFHVSDAKNNSLNLNPKNTTFMNDQGVCFSSLSEDETLDFLREMEP